ncbi:uncharacterized protein RCC_05827 [Ramularia collo-cygni]|uniref:Copper acquisition factor BIM1-like domain-containing protein n=1 Tax=Ramularia collo-cygni TaxID=112498 RepID=A0A2D3V3D4_9PEZI|nr:uncharacterized protein RCC_05827 [Ramularia collo-cygni]CZT19970.1 uncharacterized protein RCC_05827 [Ramularia collo-cygni]
MRSFLLGLATASLAAAHFQLKYPAAGFDDDLEGTGPCGGVTPVVDSGSPEITVDQFAVQIFTSHPMGNFSFFATTNVAEPYNFTEIVPSVKTTGAGDFCLTSISLPSDWAGKQGILQVVDQGPDGVLYQCAPVRFVEGANSTAGPSCKNASSFAAEWTSATTTGEETNTTSSSAGAATSTPAGAGAALKAGVGSVLGFGLLAAALAL